MRWTFYVLLSLNLVLLTWRYAIGLPEGYHKAPVEEVLDVPEHVKTIAMLGESDALPLRKVAGTKPKADTPKTCLAVGAFESEGDATAFISRLAALDVKASMKKREVSYGASHWVILPPERSRQEAKRRLAELQSRGFDSYIIPKGEWNNAISLGVFSRMDRALSRQSYLSKKGIEAEVRSVDRTHEQTWVMLLYAEEQKIGEKTLENLLSGKKSIKQQQIFCLDVASHENIH